jgi:hypothetical protein
MGSCASACCFETVLSACIFCYGTTFGPTIEQRAAREKIMKFGRTDIETVPNDPRLKRRKQKHSHEFVTDNINNKLSD